MPTRATHPGDRGSPISSPVEVAQSPHRPNATDSDARFQVPVWATSPTVASTRARRSELAVSRESSGLVKRVAVDEHPGSRFEPIIHARIFSDAGSQCSVSGSTHCARHGGASNGCG
jgi:hypothetical protein